MITDSSHRLSSLQWYASRGFAVLPVFPPNGRGCSCGDAACASPAKHPIGSLVPHGLSDATTDPTTLAAWFRERPDANLAIATGAQSNVIVIDIDPGKGGDEAWRVLCMQRGWAVDTVECMTPRDSGRHVYFRHPGVPIPNSTGKLGSGVDVRGDGGYVLVPPSRGANGLRYEWDAAHHIEDREPAVLPPWLLQLLREPTNAVGGTDQQRIHPASALAGFDEGARDDGLFRLAAKLRGADIPRDMAERLICESAAHCRPPFPERDALAKVASAYDRYVPNATTPSSAYGEPDSPPSPAIILPPSPLADPSPPAPPLPFSVFPGPVRDLIQEGAAAYGVPPDFIAVPLLALAGGTIGRSYCIQIKPTFRQFPVLWTTVVAHPGAGKTPSFDAARAGVDQLQAAARDRYERDREACEVEIANWHATSKTERGVQPTKPKMESIFTTDSTIEATAEALDHSTGFTFIRDEIVGWVKSFDAYRSGRGGDRQNWLSLWSAAPIKVDRKGADPIYLTDPVVTVVGGVQPEMLLQLAEEAGRRDGFLERMLWTFPDSAPSPWTDDSISPATLEGVATLFRQLRLTTPADSPSSSLPPLRRCG